MITSFVVYQSNSHFVQPAYGLFNWAFLIRNGVVVNPVRTSSWCLPSWVSRAFHMFRNSSRRSLKRRIESDESTKRAGTTCHCYTCASDFDSATYKGTVAPESTSLLWLFPHMPFLAFRIFHRIQKFQIVSRPGAALPRRVCDGTSRLPRLVFYLSDHGIEIFHCM